jgi:hypothetical protein
MPTEDPEDNKAYCKAYYQSLKSDPAKYAKRLASIAEARRRRKASGLSPVSKPVKQTVKHPAVSQVVSQAVSQVGRGGKYVSTQPQGEVSLTPEAIIEQWHRHFGSQEHD